MREVLQTLHNHRVLSREEAKNVLTQISKGELNNSQIASFLTIFLMRKITIEELAGFRDALLELSIPVDLKEYDPIDLCGTGGDGKNTFNISTLASFVVAGSGIKVAKHGNYGVSSTSGSSNVIEKLGFSFTNDIYKIKSQIETANICFLHAPLFHPAMKLVAPIRKELGVKTFFNMLGPMVNPSKPKKQIIGVYSLELLRLYKYLYQQTDKDYSIIYSLDGYDEISLTSDFRIVSNNEDRLMTPEEYDFQKLKQEELFGGNTVEESTKIFLKIISGDGSKAQNNAVIANAATAIKVATGNSLEDSISLASESLKSGKAYESLKQLLTI